MSTLDENTTESDAAARAAAIRFTTRGVTDEEAAAVTAVLLAAIDAEADAAQAIEPGRSAWTRSAGSMRGADLRSTRWNRSAG
ncbi:Acyl-CoA carboxylase epsilon subunit [Agromyces sp. CF514]|uniref:acyl-CoA carboxylase epsilon subunit n=1 Tax=Agromyces sp. CF514 TaxID=1881031 RepID=UPI0008E22B98|nr:acyl-CoA carboxylase epsilon subunit [Agromyces sp. CF514]SFR86217.1 Acyl-CoA carboxylase epsilon subunit [Agromyces sp. CF514]